MRILFLSHAPPHDPSDGARLIVKNLAQTLKAHHTLDLCSFVSSAANTAETREALRQTFSRVNLINLRTPARAVRWVRLLQPGSPRQVRQYFDVRMRHALSAMLNFPIDVVHCDTGFMAQYVDLLQGIPRIVAPHDCLSAALEWQSSQAPTVRERISARVQIGPMRRYEASTYPCFSKTVVVTEQERTSLQRLSPNLSVKVIPNGVDTEHFRPGDDVESSSDFGFLGVMNYAPNRSAVLWFAREILPLIWKSRPEATLTVIGRDPAQDIQALTSDHRIRVTGTVVDVRPLVASCRIMVCPILSAGGIKNKVLESMAMGKATVATAGAVAGIGVTPGVEFSAAENASTFASSCLRLLLDERARRQMGKRARDYAASQSWRAVAEQYLALYEEAAYSKHDARSQTGSPR